MHSVLGLWLFMATAFADESFDFDPDTTDVPKLDMLANSTTKDSLAKCSLPVDAGSGSSKIIRFYYDSTKKSCDEFEYRGESGNENNFGTELDCMTECYTDVKSGESLVEEDVVLLSREARDVEECVAEKDSGFGTEPTQRFYYDPAMNNCFGFKYMGRGGNANNFESRKDCEGSCLRMDGSVCKLQGPAEAIKLTADCRETQCPKGFDCFQGAHVPECCNATLQKSVFAMFDDSCPSGGRAMGQESDDFFHATTAKTCADLVCEASFECVQVTGLVAKCCPLSRPSSFQRDSPLENLPISVAHKRRRALARFFVVPPPIGRDFCGLPAERGNCTSNEQRFHFVVEWQSCFAFRYSGCGGNENRFDSREQCEQACLVEADESVCRGPQTAVKPDGDPSSCATAQCPEGYECFQGVQQAECCNTTYRNLYDETCPDGGRAQLQTVRGGSVTIFADNCFDLLCEDGFECVQVQEGVAKCCKSAEKPMMRRMSDDMYQEHMEVCPAIEKRLVKTCSQLFTDMEVIRKIWQAPRIISAEGIIQHLSIMCTKFEEYRSCLTMMTLNAACLDSTLSRKEQIFGFICQKVVREAIISTENQRCLRRISKMEKIRNCEDRLERGLINNVFDRFSVCDAFEQTLQCSASELLKCGPNTFSLMKNIIGTLKANIRECSDHNSSAEVSKEKPTKTRVKPEAKDESEEEQEEKSSEDDGEGVYESTSTTTSSKSMSRSRDRKCPQELIEKAESCTYLIGFRKIREIFGIHSDFVLTNFNTNNMNDYCDHSNSYRKCVELSLSSDPKCLHLLTEDPFYSFVVAFEDRFCEEDKKLKWLINAGCLTDVLQLPSTTQCMSTLPDGEDRLLCKVTAQMEECVYPRIKSTCRLTEVRFFADLVDMLRHRRRFCHALGPLPKAVRGRAMSSSLLKDQVMPMPLSKRGCRNSRKMAMFVATGYVPECDDNGNYRYMQCDRASGACWCVDVGSGAPLNGTHAPPGRPLPMCGLSYLFTCERLAAVPRCEPERAPPQLTERWFREGDRCVQYLHAYCPSTAHIPPMPIRTESACKSFCLPANR